MTAMIQVSVNGNYKARLKFTTKTETRELTLSGRGMDKPNVFTIYPGQGDAIVEFGPEEPDNGEGEVKGQ
jgi:hypothetical protein